MAMKEKPLKKVSIHLILIIASIMSLYPVLRVLTIALRPDGQAFSSSLAIIPENPSFQAFHKILFERGYTGGKAMKEFNIISELKKIDINEKKVEVLEFENSKIEFMKSYKELKDKYKKSGQSEKIKIVNDNKKEFDRSYKRSKETYDIYKKNWGLSIEEMDTKLLKLQKKMNSKVYQFFNSSFWTWFKNSVIVSFFTVVFGVSFASTAGYAFSRYEFPGKSFGMTFFLVTQMFPPTMLLLPLYLFMSRIGLVNTYAGLIIVYSTTALPLCVWQMKGYYDTIPYSLEEAALIDGCSPFKAFYQIIMPLVKPGLVVTALFSFMAAWTDFVVVRVMMQQEELKTLSLGLQGMNGKYLVEWSNFSAASILVMIPAMLIFIYLSKYLVSGLTLGGVKE